jgi:hypothetical protein
MGIGPSRYAELLSEMQEFELGMAETTEAKMRLLLEG